MQSRLEKQAFQDIIYDVLIEIHNIGRNPNMLQSRLEKQAFQVKEEVKPGDVVLIDRQLLPFARELQSRLEKQAFQGK